MAKQTGKPAAPQSHEHLFTAWLERTCEVLGLDRRSVSSQFEMANSVQSGLPARSIEALVEHGIPDNHIFRSVISRRTFHRRRANNETLTSEESDRAERFGRMLALATLVFGDEPRAVHWLTQPKSTLNDRVPLEMLASSVGANVVTDLLLQSYFGLVA